MRARNTVRHMMLGGAVMAALLAACGDDGTAPGADATSPTTLPDQTTAPEMTMPSFQLPPSMAPPPQGHSLLAEHDPDEDPQVTAALEDLTSRLGVAADAIEVVVWDAVTWPDGSIGCPQPGMGYTQALVEGVRIVLAHAGQTYDYHAAGTGAPFLCELRARGGATDTTRIDVDFGYRGDRR